MTKLRAAVYTRVSTNKTDQQLSFLSQQSYYTQYCYDKGYELVKIYADEGLTATNNKRKEFLAMMIDAGLSYTHGSSNKIINFDRSHNAPLFDLIIVKDVSRFARNTDVTRAADLLAEKGVYILFENNNLVTSKEGWQFELDLYLSFAKREALDRSNKVKWARKHKISQKKYHFSRIPFGYEYDQKNSEYVVNQTEAEVVQRIFDMYCYENKGCRLIAHWLTENTVLNRTAKNSATKWNESTVSRMLENQVYIGNVVVGKYENNISGTGLRKKKNKEDWVVLENAIPSIIDREVFETAQKTRSERRQKLDDNTVKGVKLSEDVFFKKIKCGLCSSEFTRVSGTKKNKDGSKRTEVTYYCKNRRKYGTCTMRGVSYNVMSRVTIEAAKKRKKYYDEKLVPRGVELGRAKSLLEILDAKERNADKQKKKIELHLLELETQQELISQAFIKANEAMVDALNEKMTKVAEQKSQLFKQLERFDLIEIEKERQRIHAKYNKIIEEGSKGITDVKEIVEDLEYVIVNENKELVFHFKSDTFLFALMNVMQLDDEVAESWSIDDDYLKESITFLVNVNY